MAELSGRRRYRFLFLRGFKTERRLIFIDFSVCSEEESLARRNAARRVEIKERSAFADFAKKEKRLEENR